MAKYICECEKKHEEDKSGVTIKFVDGKAQHQIQCPCGKHMGLKDPKSGVPSLGRMNSLGQSY